MSAEQIYRDKDRKRLNRSLLCRIILACQVLILSPLFGIDVTTYLYNNARTGLNDNESQLTPKNVNRDSFGLLFKRVVDGLVYAQPLIVENVDFGPLGVHNAVFVATEHNSVYAFDADNADGSNAQPLWWVNFNDFDAGVTPVPPADFPDGDLVPEVGITATPVIDVTSQTLFVEVMTKEPTGYAHRLHALDITTGAERPTSPILITATSFGTEYGDPTPKVLAFDPLRLLCRPALTLVQPAATTNKVVLLGFASHGDIDRYHGWLIGYDASTLRQVCAINLSPNGYRTGLWMCGNGMSVDAAGNVFGVTGNGPYDPAFGNFGDSVIKFTLSATNITVGDWFTPYNQANLNSADIDLGSGGAVVLPDEAGGPSHAHLLVAAGKEGRLYLLDRDNLGRFNPAGDNQIPQWLWLNGGVNQYNNFSSPTYYNGHVLFQGDLDPLMSFPIKNGVLGTNPTLLSSYGYYLGSTPTISANGTTNGIAWTLENGAYGRSPAILHAYNADSPASELYNTGFAGVRDVPGICVKFTVPVVSNGKVYIGTSYQLDVYGLGRWTATPVITPSGGTFATSSQISITDLTAGSAIYYTTDGSEPTLNSALYTGPFAITNTLNLKARAFAPGFRPGGIASANFVDTRQLGNGTGLQGQYWANQVGTFDGTPDTTSIDPTINFTWGSAAPPPAPLGVEHFSVKWDGLVRTTTAGLYTFYFLADDGVRLYVNNQLLINSWFDEAPTEYSGSIQLQENQSYPIHIEYYQNEGGAVAVLSWSGPGNSKQIIPQSQLYPPVAGAPPAIALTAMPSDATATGSPTLTLSIAASSTNAAIQEIDIFDNGETISALSGSATAVTLPGITVGSHSYTARAIDTFGRGGVSAAFNLTVAPDTNAAPYGLTSKPAIPAFLTLSSNGPAQFPKLLSGTGAFIDTPSFTVDPGLIAFTPKVPFWSDGAIKHRWMGIPDSGGAITPQYQIGFSQDGTWSFPVGSVFVKHFDFRTNETDNSLPRRLETRVLAYLGGGVVTGATYKWRADGSDADLVTASQTENLLITSATGIRTQAWYYPSPADCLICHTVPAGGILGASKTRQLNSTNYFPATGVVDNQIRALNHAGLLYPALSESAIAHLPTLAQTGDTNASVEFRARSYLDVNCSYCHQPGGTGRAQFDLRITTPLAGANLVNGPVVSNFGLPGAKAISPGDELDSIVYHRINTVEPLAKMPPLGRNMVDPAGVAIIGQWIDALYGGIGGLSASSDQNGVTLTWPISTNAVYLQFAASADASVWTLAPTNNITYGTTNASLFIRTPNATEFYRLVSQP
jgi:PA14 domain/Chitobiase/beta-hexosaminidase C-terminal domain